VAYCTSFEGSKNAKTGPKVLGFSLIFMAVDAP
jgi:hypothetical protein